VAEARLPGSEPAAGLIDAHSATASADAVALHAHGYWLQSFRRFRRDRVALVALATVALLLLAGFLATVIAPYDYQHFDIRNVNRPPSFHASHLFGTDGVGHDIFSRTLFGLKTSVLIGLVVGVAASLLGVAVGAVAGFYGGWADGILMWGVQFVTSIPALLLLFLGIVLVGQAPRPHWVIYALVGYMWAPMARVVRATLLSLREREYVEAARAAGARSRRIVFRHLLPNAIPAMLVTATAVVGQTILVEATLEFFGFGFDPWVTPSLGGLVAQGTNNGGIDVFEFWWEWSLPALVLVLVLVCINFVGDALDHALNPTAAQAAATA
jgi:peptide/nickel transport system permease protein